MLGRSITLNGLLLAGFALLTAIILAATYELTYEPIEQAQKEASARALYEIISRDQVDNNITEDTLLLPGFGAPLFLAKKDQDTFGVIVPTVTPEGYSGDIALLVGVTEQGAVAGVRVTRHSETPGLGDKIELAKSDWILDFNGKSLNDPEQAKWTVKKKGGNFDSFTGATITPEAVIKEVAHVLTLVKANKQAIFGDSK